MNNRTNKIKMNEIERKRKIKKEEEAQMTLISKRLPSSHSRQAFSCYIKKRLTNEREKTSRDAYAQEKAN
jgi:hypothetical protein